jgi:hypothetical protein
MCNSLANYANDFDNDINNPRYRYVYFLRLIEDITEYSRHKSENTQEYQMLSRFLHSVRDCERSEQILHELQILGIDTFAQQGSEKYNFPETNRIWQMLLRKAYWRD